MHLSWSAFGAMLCIISTKLSSNDLTPLMCTICLGESTPDYDTGDSFAMRRAAFDGAESIGHLCFPHLPYAIIAARNLAGQRLNNCMLKITSFSVTRSDGKFKDNRFSSRVGWSLVGL